MKHYLCMKTGGIMTAKDDKVLGDGWKEVEVFELDGMQWIKYPNLDDDELDEWLEPLCGFKVLLMNDDGDTSIPYVIGCGKFNSLVLEKKNTVTRYMHVLSTGEEQEDSGHGETTGCGEVVTIPFNCEGNGPSDVELDVFSNDSSSWMHAAYDTGLGNGSDYRKPSPQEAAYKRRKEQREEEKKAHIMAREAAKTVPVRCLDDVEFQNLLGMNQFVKSEG